MRKIKTSKINSYLSKKQFFNICQLIVAIIGVTITLYFGCIKEPDNDPDAKEIVSIISERFFNSRRVLTAYYKNDSLLIKKTKSNLSETIIKWNSMRHSIKYFIKNNYGDNFYSNCEQKIIYPLVEFSNAVDNDVLEKDSAKYVWSEKIKKIDTEIAILSNRMLSKH